jgi:hypothetical protein
MKFEKKCPSFVSFFSLDFLIIKREAFYRGREVSQPQTKIRHGC